MLTFYLLKVRRKIYIWNVITEDLLIVGEKWKFFPKERDRWHSPPLRDDRNDKQVKNSDTYNQIKGQK